MKTILRLLGLPILIISVVMLVWSFWPAKTSKSAEPITPGQMQLPTGVSSANNDREGVQSMQSASGQSAGIPEYRSITLEYPSKMHEGDSDVIILTLEADDQGLTATAQFGEHTIDETTVEIPNLYETHSVRVETQIDLPGADINPTEPIIMQLVQGQKASFLWTTKPETAGTYRGVVRMFLLATPLAGGQELRQALYAQALEIDVVNLFGIGGQEARMMGLAGTIFGMIFSYEDIFKLLFGRRRRKKRR